MEEANLDIFETNIHLNSNEKLDSKKFDNKSLRLGGLDILLLYLSLSIIIQ